MHAKSRLLAGLPFAVVVLLFNVISLRAAEPKESDLSPAAGKLEPEDAKAKPLFDRWVASARRDGRIPGGWIGHTLASLNVFISLNPGHELSKKFEQLTVRCDTSRDWAPEEAVALINEIEAIHKGQCHWILWRLDEQAIHAGQPLPNALRLAPWGKPAKNGLRFAWLLEPRELNRPLNSVLKCRALFQNTGRNPVFFATDDVIQTPRHDAVDANGQAISVWAVDRLGLRRRMVFRLGPGEYVEVPGEAIAIGSHEEADKQVQARVGTWIEAKVGDRVKFTPGPVFVSFQTWQNNEGRKDSLTVWREYVSACVAHEGPMPAAPEDRAALLRRVTASLFGGAPTDAELKEGIEDPSSEALEKLTQRMLAKAEPLHFEGELVGGPTEFTVTEPVPTKDGK